MSVQLSRLLESVLGNEPGIGDEVDAVFREADRLRRRRTRALISSGIAAAAAIAAAGYLLTTTFLPVTMGAGHPAAPPSAVTVPSTVADPVLTIVAPLVDGKGMRIYPRPPHRGNGWRQYTVVDRDGEPRGTLEVAVYASPEDLCFPVPAAPGKCAHTEWAPRGIEYVRYDDQDADWRVHQTIARRISDGRVVSVMATGEPGADNASRGKPALTGAQVEQIATDPRLGDAFGPEEGCTGPSSGACPVFRVPVPLPAD